MNDEEPVPADDGSRPTIVVVGNEKGGTGKSTTAIHLAIGLLYLGFSVGTLDLDLRQATLTHFLKHREAFGNRETNLPAPRQGNLGRSDSAPDGAEEDEARTDVRAALDGLGGCDAIIVDTPGYPSVLSRVGHEEADILITPVNDSLLDIDVLAEIDPVNRTVVAPSFYCRMAWEYHNRRIVEGRTPIDWIVIRNRLPHIHSHNQRDVETILRRLAQRIGFRLAPGLGERVVFRELFLNGLTVLDLPAIGASRTETSSHRSARDEVEALLRAVAIRKRVEETARRTVTA